MKTPTLLTIAAALLSAGTAAARQGPLAYDGFDMGPRPDLAGADGGTGWTGPWMDIGASIITRVTGPEDGLSYQNLIVSPGTAITPSGWLPDMTNYTRSFPAITGDAMYVSLLIRPEPDMSNWYTLRFGQYPRQVDVGVPIGSFEYGMHIGDALIVGTGIPVVAGTTNMLVLEILHDTTLGKTVYSLYVDPVLGAPKPPYADATYTRAGIMPFTSWTQLHGEGGYGLDELRIGTTWEGVTPNTPACRADFNGDGVLNVFDFLAFQTAFGEGC